MLDLVATYTSQFLSSHGPYIDSGISLNPSADNKLFSFGYVQTTLIAFEYVPWKLPDFFEVDTTFSTLELEINDGLFEV